MKGPPLSLGTQNKNFTTSFGTPVERESATKRTSSNITGISWSIANPSSRATGSLLTSATPPSGTASTPKTKMSYSPDWLPNTPTNQLDNPSTLKTYSRLPAPLSPLPHSFPYSYKNIGIDTQHSRLNPKEHTDDGTVHRSTTQENRITKGGGGTASPSPTSPREKPTLVRNGTRDALLTIHLALRSLHTPLDPLREVRLFGSKSPLGKTKTASWTSSWTRCTDFPFGNGRTQSSTLGVLIDSPRSPKTFRSPTCSNPTPSTPPLPLRLPPDNLGSHRKTDLLPYPPSFPTTPSFELARVRPDAHSAHRQTTASESAPSPKSMSVPDARQSSMTAFTFPMGSQSPATA